MRTRYIPDFETVEKAKVELRKLQVMMPNFSIAFRLISRLYVNMKV